MKEFLGKKYLSSKEASNRYGYSYSWFKKKREKHLEPHYIKFEGKGFPYYPLEETDNWFKNNMIKY